MLLGNSYSGQREKAIVCAGIRTAIALMNLLSLELGKGGGIRWGAFGVSGGHWGDLDELEIELEIEERPCAAGSLR